MKSDLAWRARVQERHMTEPAFASDQERRLVRKERFELSRSCERQPLKLVRLPVPPLSRGIRLRGWRRFGETGSAVIHERSLGVRRVGRRPKPYCNSTRATPKQPCRCLRVGAF